VAARDGCAVRRARTLAAAPPPALLAREHGADIGYYFLGGLLPAFFTVAAAGAIAWGIGSLAPGDVHATIGAAPATSRLGS